MKRSKIMSKILCWLLVLSMAAPQLAMAVDTAEDGPAPAEISSDQSQTAIGEEPIAYNREFTDDTEFNVTNIAGTYTGAVVEGGLLKLQNLGTSNRFLDADSPTAADGVFSVRFKSSVAPKAFGFAVRTVDNANQRLLIAYDSGAWKWYGANGKNGNIVEAETPEAEAWYELSVTYVGTEISITVTGDNNYAVQGTVEIPGENAYIGAGQLGAVNWGTTKNVEIDYLRWEPYEVPVEMPAESVEITLPKTEIAVGETIQAIAAVAPEGASQSVTWSIKNDANSTTGSVTSGGAVSGLAEGTFTLVATAKDTEISGEVEISVIEAPEGSRVGTSFLDESFKLISSKKLPDRPLTVEAWVNIAQYGRGVILGNYGIPLSSTHDYTDFSLFNFELTAAGEPRIYWKGGYENATGDDRSAAVDYNASGVELPLNQWTHIAITIDEAQGSFTCYVNGEQAHTWEADKAIPTLPPAHEMRVGGDYRDNMNFKGAVADVRAWSDTRTAAEIKAAYDAAVTGNEDALLANWALDSLDIENQYDDSSANQNSLVEYTSDFGWFEGEFAEGDYTIAVMPDMQYMTAKEPDALKVYTQWLADNEETRNIQFAIQLGDLVDSPSSETQWKLVQESLSTLDGAFPYTFAPGNHDRSGTNTDNYNKYFPYSKYSHQTGFGGSFPEGEMDNSYHTFTVGETEYLVLMLNFGPTDAELGWAKGVLEANPNKKVIIATHSYLHHDGRRSSPNCLGYPSGYNAAANDGIDIWNELASQYENVYLVLSGHVGYDNVVTRQDAGVHGNSVTQMLSDAQYMQVDLGMVMLLTFHEGSDDFDVNWYSIKKDQFFKEMNQFTVEVETVPDAKSVTITAPEELGVNESTKATAAVLPTNASQNVTWSVKDYSPNGNIAKDGTITALKADTEFTIVATTKNGVFDEHVIQVKAAPQVEEYHRTFDESDENKKFNYKAIQDGDKFTGGTIEGGSLKLNSFFGRILDTDSPALKNGKMTVRFQVGENTGRFGFFVRTTSTAERIMVAYDSASWKWYGAGGTSGELGSTLALSPNQWYTIEITYVDSSLKVLLTDETTGELHVIGKVTLGSAPAVPGHIGYASWYANKDMIIDEVRVTPFEGEAPPVAPEYSALTITDGNLSATLDNRFPAVNSYALDGKTMDAQPAAEFLYQVTINGEAYMVSEVAATAEGKTATYDLELTIPKNPDVPGQGDYETPLKLQVVCAVDEASGSFTMKTTVTQEPDGFRIQSLSFPGQRLASATYNDKPEHNETSLEGAYIGGGWNSVADRRFNLQDATYSVLRGGSNTPVGETFSAIGDSTLSYAFLSNGALAASILNNVDLTNQKNTVNLTQSGAGTVAAIGSGAWDYRGPKTSGTDDENFPPLESMWSQVVLRADVNSDNAVDWQDAAIGYRDCMEIPYGGEDIKDYFTYIMYNAASKAQSDTNVSADMMKKFYNLFDGFGQMQLQKGYQAEGHDDAHGDFGGHIGERIGGAEGFRELLAAGDKYNTKVGVHVNITEMMLDAFFLDNNIFKRNASDKLSVNWQWYDPAFYVDEDMDLLTGGLESRLAQLAQDTTLSGQNKSSLDWIYVDIYGRSDWHSTQVSEVFKKFGWLTATEFSGPFAQQAVWTHWGTDLYYSTSGQGSKYVRFIRNTDADIFPANDPTSGTLLKGMQQPSPNAWVNKYEIGESISLFYEQNLISKYLQHFPILSWNEENTRITFENGVVSELKNDQMVVTRNGTPVAYCDVAYNSEGKLDVRADSLVFVPWDPITEDKIYHWNPDGGETTWTLPTSWSGLENVYLYQTTENGKIRIGEVAVNKGKVTINAQANTPYVVYKTDAAAGEVVAAGNWGENSEIKDIGFDAQVFVDQDAVNGRWERSSKDGALAHIGVEKDVRWNNLLAVNSAEDAVVSQEITGLTPGKDYSISVWALVENDDNRKVVLGAENSDGSCVETYLTKTDVLAVKNKFQTTNFRRMRIVLEADETGTATVYLRVADGSNADSKVKFDDVRIWEHITDTPQDNHYYFDDFENVDFSLGALEHDSLSNDNVHLADQHPDFNNGAPQYLSYVLDGRYSGKINDTTTAVGKSLLRTHPSVLRFQPESTYRVSIDYYTPIDGAYKLVAKSSVGETLAELALPKNGEVYAIGEDGKQTDPAKRKPVGATVSFEFSTGSDENCYVSLIKTAETKDRSTSYLILDNFVVDDLTLADKSTLEVAVAEAEKLDLGGYTAESRAAFEQALAAAKKVLENEGALQGEANAALKALNDAKKGLTQQQTGGGNSGSSNTSTKTEKNPDGSTTKTVTDKKTGKVTETTTYPDGTKIVATTPKGGETSIEVTVSKDKESVTITIPTAEKPKSGEVAVIVREDGTREVVKTSVSTEDGLRVTLTGNAKLEIIDNSKNFADVAVSHWAVDAVQFAASRELFNGTGKESFSPAADMSRAMLVTVLARLDGQDTSKGDTWDAVGVAWAKENGISDGTGLEQAISREQLAVMLYRYAKAEKVNADLKDFSDASSVSSWAVEAMSWAVKSGIITGKSGTLAPQGNASRAEVATMLMRFVAL